jgi:hypothetical protein
MGLSRRPPISRRRKRPPDGRGTNPRCGERYRAGLRELAVTRLLCVGHDAPSMLATRLAENAVPFSLTKPCACRAAEICRGLNLSCANALAASTMRGLRSRIDFRPYVNPPLTIRRHAARILHCSEHIAMSLTLAAAAAAVNPTASDQSRQSQRQPGRTRAVAHRRRRAPPCLSTCRAPMRRRGTAARRSGARNGRFGVEIAGLRQVAELLRAQLQVTRTDRGSRG